MRTIAIINQKGGVAKSTTAQALGAGFTRGGSRVLYADLDAQGNLTYSLGAEAGGAGAYEALVKSVEPRAAVRTLPSGAALLASSPALSVCDTQLTATGKEYRLREALEDLSADYDIAIVDTPPSLGVLTLNALTAATGIVIPSQADIFSLQGISQLSGTLDAIRRYCNPQLKVFGILLTRYQRRSVISRESAELLEETAKALGTRLFTARIRECTALKEAQASREDIFSYAAGSNAALDYLKFYEELKEVIDNG